MADNPTVARRPFTPMNRVPRTLKDMLLRRHPRENAFVAINNLLANARSVRDVAPADIQRVCDAHRTDLRGDLGTRLERLYSDYLLFCLEDRHLSAGELLDLTHLRAVLRIDDSVLGILHYQVAQQVYGRTVDNVLEDGVIDNEERAFLATLQQELALSSRTVARIEEGARRRV